MLLHRPGYTMSCFPDVWFDRVQNCPTSVLYCVLLSLTGLFSCSTDRYSWHQATSRSWQMEKVLKMNEAQLPEVTNVPNDLCTARVALFLPGYNSPGGQWWCRPRGCSALTFRQRACRQRLMGYVRPPPLILTSFLLARALSQQCRGLAIILWGFCSFFCSSLSVQMMPRGTPPSPLLASPKGPPFGAPGQRREREKVRARWRGEKVKLKARGIVKKHTLLCVFACLLDEVSFSIHGWGKKGHVFFHTTFLGVTETNCSLTTLKFSPADFF